MTTYYGDGGEFNHFYRNHHRRNVPAACYERSPYRYHYDQARYDLRSDYQDAPGHQTLIGETEPEGDGDQQPRRRIAIAVGSNDVDWPAGLELHPSMSPPAHSATHPSLGLSSGRYDSHHSLHRPSLPTLHTRSVFPTDLDSQYDPSPVDMFANGSLANPRQDSFSSAYGPENHRYWSAGIAPMPATATTAGYDPSVRFSFSTFGTSLGPYTQQPIARLPSVAAESFSSLNMGHLNASLPAQVVHERRLPIPYVPPQDSAPFPMIEVPEIRPLEIGQCGLSRTHINNMHGRTALPWNIDTISSCPSTSATITTFASSLNGLPTTTSSFQQQTSGELSEPVLVHPFPPVPMATTTSASPYISPVTSGPPMTERYPSNSGYVSTSSATIPMSTAMFPSSTTRNMREDEPGVTAEEHLSSSFAGIQTSWYNSFGSNRAEAGSNEPYDGEEARRFSARPSWSFSSDTSPSYTTTAYSPPWIRRMSRTYSLGAAGDRNDHTTSNIRQPQPQHAPSIEALCRPSSLETLNSPRTQQQQQERSEHQRQQGKSA